MTIAVINASSEVTAKTRWCPFAVSEGVAWGSFNRNAAADYRPANCKCLASDCNAWRWTNVAATLGFCGLAGKL